MKQLLLLSLLLTFPITAQQLQMVYDIRGSIDPELNAKNFPTVVFEYLKEKDSMGSFLIKVQTDLSGENGSPGQTFIQATKKFRYWKSKHSLFVNYSGGLGVAPPSFGFFINNSYGVGLSYPIELEGTFIVLEAGYRYNAFDKASHDGQFTFYFWKGLFDYRLGISGTFVWWTENRNRGNEFTQGLNGKKLVLFADPQVWYKIKDNWSIGSRVNVFYRLLNDNKAFQFYPTFGLKYEF